MCCSRSREHGYGRRQSKLVQLYNAYKASREQQYVNRAIEPTTDVGRLPAKQQSPPMYNLVVAQPTISLTTKDELSRPPPYTAETAASIIPAHRGETIELSKEEFEMFETQIMSECREFIDRYRQRHT